MTTFTAPINVKSREMAASGPGAIQGSVTYHYATTVDVARTGTAVGTTTIPLFVAPAGSVVWEAFLDIPTGFDNAVGGTNFNVGSAARPGSIFASTSVNTAGRRVHPGTAAQVSVNAAPFATDTTIEAVVSIQTSVVSAGSVIVRVFLA